jgi:predicted ATPase/transcriptional regulator with XRE-family HTH domain
VDGEGTVGFGAWVRQRRRALDLTQADLARQVGCSTVTLRKLEAEERRPSRQMAQRLAERLGVPAEAQAAFWRFARGDPWAWPERPAESGAWAAQRRRRAPLPSPLTPLIGREDETNAILGYLAIPSTRVLTLVGPPGIGKTRLAVHAAAALAVGRAGAGGREGVGFVSLAPVADPELVGATILQALGLEESGTRPAMEQLAQGLGDRELLLVLDNFEHLLAAAPLLVPLLAACPGLKVLATSRAALRVYGERVFPVPPLAVPTGAAAEPEAVLARYAAVRLFVERARDVSPDFSLNETNLAAVTGLCARLDGLPLAIELAAARVGQFSPQALQEGLSGAALLRADGLRGRPDRQRTLQQAIGWSYALLGPAEQAALARLGVFAGGFSLAAAQAVAGGEGLRVERLEALVDHSLLQRQAGPRDPGQEPRYALLATVREFARERLAARGEAEEARGRHAVYYRTLAEGAAPHLTGADQKAWLAHLADHLDDLRAAFEWSLAGGGERETALRLQAALHWFWIRSGRLSEGWQWSARCLAAGEAGGPARLWAALLYVAGEQAYFRGEYATARAWLEESLARFRALGDALEVARVLGILAMGYTGEGDLAQAERLQAEGLELAYHWRDDWLIGTGLMNLAEMQRNRGLAAEVEPLQAEGLACLRRAGDKMFTAMLLDNMGQVAQYLGDYERAQRRHREGLALFRALEDYRGLAMALERLAGLAARLGRPVRAARLLGGAQVLRESVGAPIEMVDRADHAQTVALAQAGQDPAAFAAAWAEGRALGLEALLAEAELDMEVG